jgi:hypothetical protein
LVEERRALSTDASLLLTSPRLLPTRNLAQQWNSLFIGLPRSAGAGIVSNISSGHGRRWSGRSTPSSSCTPTVVSRSTAQTLPPTGGDARLDLRYVVGVLVQQAA